MLGGSEFPDVCMDGIARHKKDFMNYSSFFRDAAAGTFMSFQCSLRARALFCRLFSRFSPATDCPDLPAITAGRRSCNGLGLCLFDCDDEGCGSPGCMAAASCTVGIGTKSSFGRFVS